LIGTYVMVILQNTPTKLGNKSAVRDHIDVATEVSRGGDRPAACADDRAATHMPFLAGILPVLVGIRCEKQRRDLTVRNRSGAAPARRILYSGGGDVHGRKEKHGMRAR
jgi:hypothetical protein